MLNNLNKQNIVLPAAIALVALLIIAAIFSYKDYRQFQEEPPTPLMSEQPGLKEKKTPKVNYMEKVVFALQGSIEQLSENSITVRTAENEPNPFLKERSFTVEVNDDTEIFLVKGAFYIIERETGAELTPMTIPGKEDGQEQPQQSNIVDLAVGDFVAILSTEDIKEKDYFLAEKIYKRK